MDITAVLVELSVELGRSIGREGFALDEKAPARFRKWFEDTVGAALEKNAKTWTHQHQRYVHKQVDRIGRDACGSAEHQGLRVVSADILDETIRDRIHREKQVCASPRVESLVSTRGVFCENV